jgi:hypothetical protein
LASRDIKTFELANVFDWLGPLPVELGTAISKLLIHPAKVIVRKFGLPVQSPSVLMAAAPRSIKRL